MTLRAFRWTPSSVGAFSLTLVALGFLLFAANRSVENEIAPYTLNLVVAALSFSTVGAIVASRQWKNFIGWLLLGTGVLYATELFAGNYSVYTFLTNPGSLPGGPVAAWLTTWVYIAGATLVLFVFLFFPDGKLPSSRWRPLAWLILANTALSVAPSAFDPGPLRDFTAGASVTNPVGIEGSAEILDLSASISPLLWIPISLAVVFAFVVRFRRAQSEQRQQIKWVAYAVAVFAFAVVGVGLWPSLDGSLMGNALFLVGFLAIPSAMALAILKYRLYDIDIIINRTLVYGALSAIVVGVYVAVVGLSGALFRNKDDVATSLVAAGVVAVMFAPLRDRLQRAVNRLMYGERDDPYGVLSELGERLEGTLSTAAVLPTITETVARALKLPYAAIVLQRNGEGAVLAAECGDKEAAGELLSVPLTYQKEEVGELRLAPRSPGEAFGKADVRLLENLARQAGVAARAVRLTEDLQRSRERLVTAREEERRRLRRDLHDGVGPQLAALTLELDAASELVSDDPEAYSLMAKLTERARDAVADVRRSVYALRPPSLDELGLVSALTETAARYARDGLWMSVEAPEVLPALPAAVEVACYRIAQEAMTNAVRHAQASNCRVRIRVEEEAGVLRVEVEDDGRGISENDRAGVGMSSMRERAEELGGLCSVGPSAQGGTLVSADLPYPDTTRGTDPGEE